ncbi:Carboxylic ester hydrolase [Venustampulla echinocandica]|uniref:Carboxylic ester hydrolase n=1 Tax=Venustampulla echinocandica TaxID=2656787 RepID=A0A370TBM2_9HELO|nr:Carboxylic ester hydrolase [Venustampulla echinocandica]RDL31458.1 Carboxylic ester hydrolase [Venustampulla echinocandica]
MAFKFLIVILTVVQLSQSIPSPNGIGSDLTLLINNDLLGPQSPSANSGVILLTTRSQRSAASACEKLGESLWAPELNTSSIQPTLDYLTFQGKYPQDQQYWIASSPSALRAIDGRGRISDSETLPWAYLPALCTQSAPFSNISAQDTSSKWQVAVHSNNDDITGFRDRLSFRFLGIRYAPQPKRFTYSTPYIGAKNNVSATSYGSQCIQSGTDGSEDCLFLNVWTPYLPAHGGDTRKPVMFWIHGGAFTGGTGNDPTFDGGNIASRGDVVMVAINYRLGSLGFLALDDGVTKGNYGLADIVNALDWVRNNIRDFGGDPDRITIFGQSAGAASVRALLASPKAKGKFAAAIPMSNLGGGGYGTTYSSWMTIDSEVSTTANPILTATNCSTASSKIDCLRAVPASKFPTLPATARYLVVDGTYLTTSELPLGSDAEGSLSKVHLLQGLMRDDGGAITSYIQTTNLSESITTDGFNTSVVVGSPNLFPIPEGSNATLNIFNVTARVATDTIFRCVDQAAAYAGVLNNVFAPNQYFYEFNRSYQTPGWDPNAPVCDAPITSTHPHGNPDQEYFKCHSGELYYVFGTILRMGYTLRDENDLPFEQFTLDSWTSFARTYDPNPDVGLLKARNYSNTIAEIEKSGTWAPLSNGERNGGMVRQLQWPNTSSTIASYIYSYFQEQYLDVSPTATILIMESVDLHSAPHAYTPSTICPQQISKEHVEPEHAELDTGAYEHGATQALGPALG